MCEGLCLNQTRNGIDCSSSTRADNHIGPSQLTRCSVSELGLYCFRPEEASRAEDEFRAALFVIAEIHVIPARHHAAFALANSAHVHSEISVGDAELFASANVPSNLRAVNDVFAGQTGDIRARSANVFALDNRDTLPLPGKRPGSNRRSRAAAKNHQVEFFRLWVLRRLGALTAIHADFLFWAGGSLFAFIDFARSAADAPSSDSP